VFESTLPFLLFDYFRVPYRLVPADPARLEPLPPAHPLRGSGRLRWAAPPTPPRALCWPAFDTPGSPLAALARPGRYELGSIPIYGRVLRDDQLGRWLHQTGGRWEPATAVRGPKGTRVASVWRDEDGGLFLPYDPGEVIRNYWSERYRSIGSVRLGGPARKAAVKVYYRVRPVLPRPAQLRLRRMASQVQARSRFPRWPVETALHDLYARLLDDAAAVAGAPVPWLSPWPEGRSWALVLTHDVETSAGYRNLHLLKEAELRHGYRSSWNFVPRRYPVDDAVVQELLEEGFEVGVHGLYHDGRDLGSPALVLQRLPAMRAAADRWHAVGFRAPATQRRWEWMPLLGFDYDSSYPDTDPFEPQAGGCCTWLPYHHGQLVELPITLPQDHTLFTILGHADERLWVHKAEELRRRGGMALLLTHPDYVHEQPLLDAYVRVLRRFASDPTAWRALPREVDAWWRRRAATWLEPGGDGWRVAGPAAAEATVTYWTPGASGVPADLPAG
jgi:hypothetical protein